MPTFQHAPCVPRGPQSGGEPEAQLSLCSGQASLGGQPGEVVRKGLTLRNPTACVGTWVSLHQASRRVLARGTACTAACGACAVAKPCCSEQQVWFLRYAA